MTNEKILPQILGDTGAVSTGDLGALFLDVDIRFFGMLSNQRCRKIYKDRQGNDYVGGLPCYRRKLLGGATFVGGAFKLFLRFQSGSLLGQRK